MALISGIYGWGAKVGDGKISATGAMLNAAAANTGYDKTVKLVKTYKAAKAVDFTIADFVVAAENVAA